MRCSSAFEKFKLGYSKDLKVEEEATSTTEEESNSAVGYSSESDVRSETTNAGELDDEQQEALRQYSERFGVDRIGKKMAWKRESFGIFGSSSQSKAPEKPVEEVLAALDRDMISQQGEDEPMQYNLGMPDDQALEISDVSLLPTFSYVGGLNEDAPFAMFDNRDEVCLKVGGFKHGQVVRDRSGFELVVVGVTAKDGKPRLWFHPKDLGRPGAGAFNAVPTLCGTEEFCFEHLQEVQREAFAAELDSDGEEMVLCHHCRLPVGCNAYLYGKEKYEVHGECMAHLTVTNSQKEQAARKKKDTELKKADRKKYDIGWKVDEVPLNTANALKLGCPVPPKGMCSLKFDRQAHTVSVVPTLEPAESVNLEYLSLALQVRLQEGREPLFSLDPIDSELKKESMQEKRFEPEWLAGTSAGEVMFQADYHLKELSMGEYSQPVVGMKSCFDFSEIEDFSNQWSARQWFVVRKADIGITEDDLLVPRVRMGVEAREQSWEAGELVDIKCTRPNHPMVKFAEGFTHWFDLIAERKSVVFHLRELAKASVLAKMLVEGSVQLDTAWLNLAPEAKEMCPMEVPQLWHERYQSKLHVRGGKILESEEGNRKLTRNHGTGNHGIYGGVSFGLDKAIISMPPPVVSRGRMSIFKKQEPGIAVSAAPGAPVAAVGRPLAAVGGVSAGQLPLPPARLVQGKAVGSASAAAVKGPSASLASTTVPGRLRLAMDTSVKTVAPARAISIKPLVSAPARGIEVPAYARAPPPGAAPTSMAGMPGATAEQPQGVDLNLDQFSLSNPVEIEGSGWGAARDVKSAAIGSAFWTSLDDFGSEFRSEDRSLLDAIYNPRLSDRRDEADRFIPPDTSFDYVERLRSLVKEEEACRKLRSSRFFSRQFSIMEPGDLFPSSWATPFVLDVHGKIQGMQQGAVLTEHPDYLAQAHKFDEVLKSTTPTFNKTTEDMVKFRVYHVGSLEVRTTQEPDGEEVIGAVFSVKSVKRTRREPVGEDEKVAKVTEYIESVQGLPGLRHCYIVIETDKGSHVLTEKLANGKFVWEENPMDLEDRNSLAKGLRSEPSTADLASVKEYFIKESQKHVSRASFSKCKKYNAQIFSLAMGERDKLYATFRSQKDTKWQLSDRNYNSWSQHLNAFVDPAKVERPGGKRPSVGDKVREKASGRLAVVSFDDKSDMPYTVAFVDGAEPANKWCNEGELEWP